MLNDLKKYYESQNISYLKKYVEVSFDKEDFHRVIIYGTKIINDFHDIKTLIFIAYSYAKLNYIDHAKKIIKNKEIELCEYFLTSNLDMNILFKLLFYLEIDIKNIKQFIANFDNIYSENHYYNIYYYSAVLHNNPLLMFKSIENELVNLEFDTHFVKRVKNFILSFNQNTKNSNTDHKFKYFHNKYITDELMISSFDTSNGMATCTILKHQDRILLVDCGAMISFGAINKIDLVSFLNDNNVSISDISGVLITHAHLDHYGSLSYFENTNIPVFMTKTTFELINLGGSNIDFRNLKIVFISDEKTFKINGFKVTAVNNGHIIGSVAYYVSSNNIKLFFTGDFTIHDQNTVNGMNLNNIPGKVDILISESTYGTKTADFSRRDNEIMLANIIQDSLNIEKSVFIPAFAIGRTQELLSVKRKYNIDSVMVVDGLSKLITSYYESNLNKRMYDLDIVPNNYKIDKSFFNIPKIIVASSGMLATDSVFIKKYFKYINFNKSIFVKVGYMEPDNIFYDKLIDDIDANIFNINLSAHADYNDLIYTINKINPKTLITNHGNGIRF